MTMRRLLLVGVAVVGGYLASPTHAHAQWAVACVTCPTEIQEALRFGKTVMEYANQLRELQGIYSQAQMIVWAMTNIRDLGTAVGALQAVGISNPLPINPYSVQGLMSGYGGAGGMLANIGTLFETNRSNAAVYTCNFGPWLCKHITQRRDGLAGSQALSMQLYASSGERQQQLAALQAQLPFTKTPAEQNALLAQIAAVQAQSTSQGVQAQAIQTYTQANIALAEQQGNERILSSSQAVLADARARGFMP